MLSRTRKKGVKDSPKCNYCNKLEIQHGMIGKKKNEKNDRRIYYYIYVHPVPRPLTDDTIRRVRFNFISI